MLAQQPPIVGRPQRRAVPVLVCVALLGGCGPRRAEVPATAGSAVQAPSVPVLPAEAQAYRVDPDGSAVTLRVYRAGRLAALGHNHVITSTAETGRVWTTGEPEGSGFEVRVPVAGLVVDDPAARAAAGADFPGEVPDAARDGTRRNMLRAEVLDGEHFPEIVVSADALGGSWAQPVVAARVTLRGMTRSIGIPLAIEWESRALTARGNFRILQSDFGITPFSVGGGAIAVADAVDVAFEIRAVPQD
jgi:polyisoprenoid-binding protein YceI